MGKRKYLTMIPVIIIQLSILMLYLQADVDFCDYHIFIEERRFLVEEFFNGIYIVKSILYKITLMLILGMILGLVLRYERILLLFPFAITVVLFFVCHGSHSGWFRLTVLLPAMNTNRMIVSMMSLILPFSVKTILGEKQSIWRHFLCYLYLDLWAITFFYVTQQFYGTGAILVFGMATIFVSQFSLGMKKSAVVMGVIESGIIAYYGIYKNMTVNRFARWLSALPRFQTAEVREAQRYLSQLRGEMSVYIIIALVLSIIAFVFAKKWMKSVAEEREFTHIYNLHIWFLIVIAYLIPIMQLSGMITGAVCVKIPFLYCGEILWAYLSFYFVLEEFPTSCEGKWIDSLGKKIHQYFLLEGDDEEDDDEDEDEGIVIKICLLRKKKKFSIIYYNNETKINGKVV